MGGLGMTSPRDRRSEQRVAIRTDGISRRGFLIGTGLTFAAASHLGGWVDRAAAADDVSAGLSTVGFADGFDELAAAAAPAGYRAFAAVAASGAGTVRFPLRWDAVHIEVGGFDWSAYDALHRQLVWHGLKALPVLIGAPSWLRGETKRTRVGLRYPVGATALNEFGDFVTATLQHFTRLGDHIAGVEIWSEPNNPNGAYIPEPAEFSRMLATAAMFADAENRLGRLQGRKVVVAGGLSLAETSAPWQTYLGGFTTSTSRTPSVCMQERRSPEARAPQAPTPTR